MQLSKDRRIKNELVFRQRNKLVEKVADSILDGPSRDYLELNFVCECSDPNCTKTLSLSLNDYRRYHRRDNQFIIATGHQHADIEAVVERQSDYTVVAKQALKA